MSSTSEGRAISDEVRDIHVAAYERPLSTPVITDVTDHFVTCQMTFALTEADELLIDRGHAGPVHDARSAFQTTLSSALSAAVERATGRRVLSHASHIDLGERSATETFSLAPTTLPLDGDGGVRG